MNTHKQWRQIQNDEEIYQRIGAQIQHGMVPYLGGGRVNNAMQFIVRSFFRSLARIFIQKCLEF